MSNKRIAKKRSTTMRPASPRAIRRLMVEVPCPSCAHPVLERRYLPAIGGLNGTVACPSCAAETSYIHALHRAVGNDAPDVVTLPRAPVEPVEKSPSIVVVLRDFFGLRRRWRFAA
jgi:hypothetical protein